MLNNQVVRLKNINAKTVKQIIEQRELRALIAEHTNIVPPPIKAKDFQDIISGLWSQLNVETPDPESQPAGILFRHLKEYLNDVRTTTLNGFKSGSVYVEEDKAYFLFHKFYEELKEMNGVWMKMKQRQWCLMFLKQTVNKKE